MSKAEKLSASAIGGTSCAKPLSHVDELVSTSSDGCLSRDVLVKQSPIHATFTKYVRGALKKQGALSRYGGFTPSCRVSLWGVVKRRAGGAAG